MNSNKNVITTFGCLATIASFFFSFVIFAILITLITGNDQFPSDDFTFVLLIALSFIPSLYFGGMANRWANNSLKESDHLLIKKGKKMILLFFLLFLLSVLFSESAEYENPFYVLGIPLLISITYVTVLPSLLKLTKKSFNFNRSKVHVNQTGSNSWFKNKILAPLIVWAITTAITHIFLDDIGASGGLSLIGTVSVNFYLGNTS